MKTSSPSPLHQVVASIPAARPQQRPPRDGPLQRPARRQLGGTGRLADQVSLFEPNNKRLLTTVPINIDQHVHTN